MTYIYVTNAVTVVCHTCRKYTSRTLLTTCKAGQPWKCRHTCVLGTVGSRLFLGYFSMDIITGLQCYCAQQQQHATFTFVFTFGISLVSVLEEEEVL